MQTSKFFLTAEILYKKAASCDYSKSSECALGNHEDYYWLIFKILTNKKHRQIIRIIVLFIHKQPTWPDEGHSNKSFPPTSAHSHLEL